MFSVMIRSELIVVSVVVGLRNTSIYIVEGCRINSKSRNLMLLFCSGVGVNWEHLCHKR